MESLSQTLRDKADQFLIQNGVLEHAFLDLRQVPPNEALKKWLSAGNAGSMQWIKRTENKRINALTAFPQFPCALLCSLSYYDIENVKNSSKNRISIYAQGRDYHKVLGKILKHCLKHLQNSENSLEGRFYVDTGPVSEKFLASHTKLGWIGKSTNLTHPRHGSFFFLGILLLNRQCDDYTPTQNHCGTCVRCLVACPTSALYEPYKIDARKCISYQTIENKSITPQYLVPENEPWLYGCDECQSVCPYNRFSKPTPIDDFKTRPNYDLDHFLELDEPQFLKEFEGSPIRRIGYNKFMQNLLLLVSRMGDAKQIAKAAMLCKKNPSLKAIEPLLYS
tara:strand:+ start:4976 stop:5983 length:1008 start_codon:yes stop_codon:yes gene_type:complete